MKMEDLEERHQAIRDVARRFDFEHLPEGKPRDMAQEISDFAAWVIDVLPDSPELTHGLRKLLEAKDCFVRAAIEGEE